MNEGDRQTGRTTAQMRNAPQGATFVWCNSHIDYPRSLARHLGRDDLKIVSPSIFEHPERLRGLGRGMVVIDHYFIFCDHSAAVRRGMLEFRVTA